MMAALLAKRTALLLAGAALALVASACGEDPPEPSSPPPADQTAAGDGDAGKRANEPAQDEEPRSEPEGSAPPGEAPGRSAESGGCVFEAPPGRLAEAEVAIELDGVDCAKGRSLARAAALGQPAGANLTVNPDGFRCVPSTGEPGENVTYTCTGEAGEARFDVLWTASP